MIAGRAAITGARGQLGRQLAAAFAASGWEVLALGHDQLDIGADDALEQLEAWRPTVVINAAAWTDVDGCARDPQRALRINGAAAGRVAEAAARAAALIVQVSTNEVFDGAAERPYLADDAPNPVNPYGASKLAGERAVAAATPDHLIVRTAWVFGPGGRNFPTKIVDAARRRAAADEPLSVVADEFGNPTWAPDLADGIRGAVEAIRDGRLRPGILHVAGEPPVSRFDWAREILAALSGLRLVPISATDFPRASRTPLRAVLSTEQAAALGIGPFDWRPVTRQYAAELLAGASD